MPVRTPIFEEEDGPRYVHFLTSGIASIVTMMETGEAVEGGLVGFDGFPEKVHVLGPQRGMTRCFMQMAGAAWRMDFRRFQAEFLRDPDLLKAVHQFVQHDALVLAQLGACNRLHEVEERLARWLLMVQDLVESDEIRITQEFLGEMLGARRSSVTLAAGSLQRSGVIAYSRGRIFVTDRAALEGVACECYPIIAKLTRNLYR